MRKILYYEHTDIGLYEKCNYNFDLYDYCSFEMSKKINNNYAKLMLYETEIDKKELRYINNIFSVVFAYGNKNDVNNFILNSDTKIKLKNTTSDISGLIFAISSIKFLIDRLKNNFKEFAIIVYADDKKRFKVYSRLLKIGFKQIGIINKNPYSSYYLYHCEN